MTRNTIAALGAIAFAAAPALSHADTMYYLVGSRHVYRIGLDPYFQVDARRQIEQGYADWVAGDQDSYNKNIANGGDPAAESDALNADLAKAADDRDAKLADLYQSDDRIRIVHPELQVEGDGPYQVIGVHFHHWIRGLAFDSFQVFAPWPGYVGVDAPYGWAYGQVYSPYDFRAAYNGWYANVYVAGGRPAFSGLVGVNGAVSLSINVGGSAGHPFVVRGRSSGPYRPNPGLRYDAGRPRFEPRIGTPRPPIHSAPRLPIVEPRMAPRPTFTLPKKRA